MAEVAAQLPTQQSAMDGLLDSVNQTAQSVLSLWGDYTRIRLQRDQQKQNAELLAQQQADAFLIRKKESEVALAKAQADLESAKVQTELRKTLFGYSPEQILLVGGVAVAAFLILSGKHA